jgi:hypothetical protein
MVLKLKETWYRLSAEQGNDAAQSSLGLMYEAGRGVPQDYAKAHPWFNLAAMQTWAVLSSMTGQIANAPTIGGSGVDAWRASETCARLNTPRQ